MVMSRIVTFARSELFLSLVGGFAIGVAGLSMLKPASATSEKNDSRAVLIETTDQVAQSHGTKAR
jgi:hypothetical protein